MPEYAPGAAFVRSREAFAHIEGWLEGAGAAGLEHAALEEELAARGREVQRLLLQDHLDAAGGPGAAPGAGDGPGRIARTRAEKGHALRWPACG